MSPVQVASPPHQRFDVLDALRGVCALLVALYHFKTNGLLTTNPIAENGWLFVDYFFVLSGFVIAHSYGERIANGSVSIKRFMGLRMGRIYPLHLAVLFAFIALELVLVFGDDWISQYVDREPFTGSRGLESLFQSLFLLQSFGVGSGWGWNGPAWSIAAEMWTYLLFAVIFLANRRVMFVISIGLAVVSAGWLMAYADDLHVTFNGGILRCIFGFSIGVLTYHAFLKFGGFGGTLQELVALILTLLFVAIAEDKLTFLAPLVFAAMIFVLAAQKGAVSRILSWSPFQKLGLISYSIYMIHVFIQARIGEILQITDWGSVQVDSDGRTLIGGSQLSGDIITLVMVFVLVTASLIGYYLVERPGRDISRKLIAK